MCRIHYIDILLDDCRMKMDLLNLVRRMEVIVYKLTILLFCDSARLRILNCVFDAWHLDVWCGQCWAVIINNDLEWIRAYSNIRFSQNANFVGLSVIQSPTNVNIRLDNHVFLEENVLFFDDEGWLWLQTKNLLLKNHFHESISSRECPSNTFRKQSKDVEEMKCA